MSDRSDFPTIPEHLRPRLRPRFGYEQRSVDMADLILEIVTLGVEAYKQQEYDARIMTLTPEQAAVPVLRNIGATIEKGRDV